MIGYLQCLRTVLFRSKPVGSQCGSPVYPFPSDPLFRDVTTVTSDPWTKYLSLETSTVLAGYINIPLPISSSVFFYERYIYIISPDFLRAEVSKIDIIFLFILFFRRAFQGHGAVRICYLKKDGLTAFGNWYAGAVFWIKANISVQSRKCPIWRCPFLACVRIKRKF